MASVNAIPRSMRLKAPGADGLAAGTSHDLLDPGLRRLKPLLALRAQPITFRIEVDTLFQRHVAPFQLLDDGFQPGKCLLEGRAGGFRGSRIDGLRHGPALAAGQGAVKDYAERKGWTTDFP